MNKILNYESFFWTVFCVAAFSLNLRVVNSTKNKQFPQWIVILQKGCIKLHPNETKCNKIKSTIARCVLTRNWKACVK